jgi:hypothetical protein
MLLCKAGVLIGHMLSKSRASDLLRHACDQVSVWNFKGELVTDFEDHQLWHPDTNTNNIFITNAQDYIISYCRPAIGSSDAGASEVRSGTINVSSIHTGRCIAKLASSDDREMPLEVSSLYFSEERNELYVGDKQGLLHVYNQ